MSPRELDMERLCAALRVVFPTNDGAGYDQLPHNERWFQTRAEKLARAYEETEPRWWIDNDEGAK